MFGMSWRIVAPLTSPVGLLIWVSQPENLWSSLAATSVLITILASIMLIFAQRYLITGLTGGSVKG